MRPDIATAEREYWHYWQVKSSQLAISDADADIINAEILEEVELLQLNPAIDRAPPPPILTAFQRQQLTARRDALFPEWNLRTEKVKRLRSALGIETDVAVKLKLEWQLSAEEVELEKLGVEIGEIDQKLS